MVSVGTKTDVKVIDYKINQLLIYQWFYDNYVQVETCVGTYLIIVLWNNGYSFFFKALVSIIGT